MAKDKKTEAKIVLKRTYNVPLRKEFQKAPRYRRAKKAVIALKTFLRKHMKSDDVKIGKYLNKELWKHGIKNPPHHVQLEATKDDKGVVRAELVGAPKEGKKLEKPKKKEEKKEEEKTEKKTEEKKEKVENKEELKKTKKKESDKKESIVI